MTIPAKIVAGAGHVTVGTGLNLLGTAVNTTENLVGLVADTGKDLLDTLKNPLKKDVWKAIGNRHKSRIKNFTAHQKEKFQEYIAPLQGKWDKIKRPSKLLGNTTHAVTGGAVLAVATALDAGWRGVASPFVGVANRFRKKDKRVKLWESFRKNQKKRKEKFDSGFSELKGEVKEKIDEAVDKVNEEVKEVLAEKEDFVEEEIKRNRKNDNKEKEKAWEKAKEKGKKENTSADSVGQKNSEQKQITAEEQRVKAEIEEIKNKDKYEYNETFANESFAIAESITKESEELKGKRIQVIESLKTKKGEMNNANKKIYREYDELFQKEHKDNQKTAQIASDLYKVGIFEYSNEKDYQRGCLENAKTQLSNYLVNKDITDEEKEKYEKIFEKVNNIKIN